MSVIFASIVISESEIESDRIFSDKRNSFRGLFDIVNLISEHSFTKAEMGENNKKYNI